MNDSSESSKRSWPRALLWGWLGWTAYAALYAAILTLQSGVPFLYSFSASLLSHYLMALYSIPVWFLTTRVLAYRGRALPWAGHVAGAFAYAVIWHWSFLELFHRAFGEQVWQRAKLFEIRYWLIHEALLVYGAFVGFFYMRRYQRQLAARERQEADLRLHAKQMELAVLKGQLHPHFLFNTLNSINALVRSDPEGARQMLAQLAELLRYALDSDRNTLVALAEELRLVEVYLAIEKARFGRRLAVQMEIDESARARLVPPMILQPLVENAVKHGIAPQEHGGKITVRAQQRGETLRIEVEDNGRGAAGGAATQLLASGTGLRNTDQRLRKMFNETAALQISNGAAGFRVSFEIPVVQA